jgi:hypothetical protein
LTRDAILRKLFSATVLMVLGLHCGSAGAADAQTLRAGDIATVFFPLVTFGIAYAKDDVEGEKQRLRDLGVNEVLNTGLRVASTGQAGASGRTALPTVSLPVMPASSSRRRDSCRSATAGNTAFRL